MSVWRHIHAALIPKQFNPVRSSSTSKAPSMANPSINNTPEDRRPAKTQKIFRQAGAGIFAGALALTLAACAPTNIQDMRGLSAQRFAQLEQICQQTMQLSPGNTRFDACLDSLSKTSSVLDQTGHK
jgi:hypothetical protein